MIEIQLHSQKYPGFVALIDDRDYDVVSQYRWYVHSTGCAYGKALRNRIPVRMHRLIMNPPSDMFIDHIDHNRLNNQRSNLRICTREQNQANSFPKAGTSRFKGIYFDKKYNVWRAQITMNRKKIYLGAFENETDAAEAYDKKAIELKGEFALTNKEFFEKYNY